MLNVSNLYAYYGNVEVLHGISLQVPEGKVVALIGANGAGKTTTMRAISGLLKQVKGSIVFNGTELSHLQAHQVANLGLAHCPEGRRVFPTMSVQDNLVLGAYGRITGKRPSGNVKEDLDQQFDLFPKLKERRKQLAGTLSGGEQQMLAMARALMSKPDLILLDEPSMGLAPLLVEEVFQIIRRLKANGMTMLVVEQFAAAVLEVADYGYVVENGRIATHGTSKALLSDPALQSAYLGSDTSLQCL